MSVGEQEYLLLCGLFPTTIYIIQYSVSYLTLCLSLSLPVYLFDELAVDLIT